jgi:hypothetical protein
VHDAFARAAMRESPVVLPENLAPTPRPFGQYTSGKTITNPLTETADILIILYTEYELQALLDVFTRDSSWSPARRADWYPYGHNFAALKSSIDGSAKNDALRENIFGYLYALSIGTKKTAVALGQKRF